MLITTTPAIEGKKITSYCGLVIGEAILGANVFKDIMAGFRDIVGGRSKAYEKELQNARNIAIREMSDKAATLGCNAVIGVDLDYETLSPGGRGSMLMVTVSGTAVTYE